MYLVHSSTYDFFYSFPFTWNSIFNRVDSFQFVEETPEISGRAKGKSEEGDDFFICDFYPFFALFLYRCWIHLFLCNW